MCWPCTYLMIIAPPPFRCCVHHHAGAHLEPVAKSTAPLTLSLRYEPPSPKFSRSQPGLASYRVKLLQGAQFIYLHRGLPKVCLVDRQARCLSWGPLQLVFKTSEQLDSVLAVLRHADVQHAVVWPPQISQLWLGAERDSHSAAAEAAEEATAAPPSAAEQPAAATEVAAAAVASQREVADGTGAGGRSSWLLSWWPLCSSSPTPAGVAADRAQALLAVGLAASVVAAGFLLRSYARQR